MTGAECAATSVTPDADPDTGVDKGGNPASSLRSELVATMVRPYHYHGVPPRHQTPSSHQSYPPRAARIAHEVPVLRTFLKDRRQTGRSHTLDNQPLEHGLVCANSAGLADSCPASADSYAPGDSSKWPIPASDVAQV